MTRAEVEAIRYPLTAPEDIVGRAYEKLERALDSQPEQEGGDEPCAHADQPHTVWWWNERVAEHMPIPDEARFDNQADALAAAKKLVDNPSIAWIKVFRSDNESYTCWRWSQEDPYGWGPGDQRDIERAEELIAGGKIPACRPAEEAEGLGDDDNVLCECCGKRLPSECAATGVNGEALCGTCVAALDEPILKAAFEVVEGVRVVGNGPIPRLRKLLNDAYSKPAALPPESQEGER